MAVLNFVVPPLAANTFTGGIYCIARHALGLQALGHTVNLIPLLPSPRPNWIEGDLGIPDGSRRANNRRVWREIAGLIGWPGVQRPAGMRSRDMKQRLTTAWALRNPRLLSPALTKALHLEYVAECIPSADATVATSYETALPVRLYGTGRKFYFAQHFEPVFAIDAANPEFAEFEALGSYHLGLRMIANSSWLRLRLQQETGSPDVALCPNAIDHRIFNGESRRRESPSELRVISYGGRNARWKGFAEMAEAMRIARQRAPHLRLRWLVYGTSLLPPDNAVAPYEDLGFLQPLKLAEAYRSADLLLSASWYESFPLFPIEAMACGLPVITTQAGTEEYAIDGETAAIVETKNPENIAAAILRFANDETYRYELALRGQTKSREFSWETAPKRMEQVLLNG